MAESERFGVKALTPRQFVTTALAEKMAALMTLDYLNERAGRGSRSKFDRVLAKVKDRKPAAGDDLP